MKLRARISLTITVSEKRILTNQVFLFFSFQSTWKKKTKKKTRGYCISTPRKNPIFKLNSSFETLAFFYLRALVI